MAWYSGEENIMSKSNNALTDAVDHYIPLPEVTPIWKSIMKCDRCGIELPDNIRLCDPCIADLEAMDCNKDLERIDNKDETTIAQKDET